MKIPMQSVTEALANISHQLHPISGTRTVALRDALDSVLAHEVLSPIDVPAHMNSAMDGYALNGADIQPDSNTSLKIIGTVLAGKPLSIQVPRGSCVRIMTGAVVPYGCDTVVVQELVQLSSDGQEICFQHNAVRAGDNVRHKGEDLTRGRTAIPAGKVLRPADLGLLASLGVAEVQIKRPLRVAFFSTGDELRSLGQVLDEGCIYDSNRYTIYGMLKRLRFVDILDMGVVEDSPEALEAAMLQAAGQADVIITSGGVSVGEADFTKSVMSSLGQVEFWTIAMRPGRPMAFGSIRKPGMNADPQNSAILFGLPGNPVAVMVTFYAFVRQALHHMAGADCKPLPMLKAKLLQQVRKKPGRTEYQRVTLHLDQGEWIAELTGSQGSGVLRSMAESDGLMVLHHESGNVPAGDWVDVLPFEGLI